MKSEEKNKGGRPSSGEPERTGRNIRLNDQEWEIFRVKLGPAWLRAEIKKAAQTNN